MAETFHALGQELASHLMKEEKILFPYVAKLEQSNGQLRQASCFCAVENPIRMMTMEHESAGEALGILREATGGYKTPEDACLSFRTLYRALEEFEADLRQHIHLENNLLFPRAVALEKSAGDAHYTPM